LHGILKVSWGSLIVDLIPSKQLSGRMFATDGLDGLSPDVEVGQFDKRISDDSTVFSSYNVSLPFNVYDVDVLSVILGNGR